ncbi:uncharacterized protein LOC126792134 [Argentina anserina]|uniref:uncharacterized protein LOC126792134 n=1 Tax=Argentina anserina TaxID=57926 RepID=UPI0021764E49|nr:uncharacterized protein LOC126792134 [Potentilla anserina]
MASFRRLLPLCSSINSTSFSSSGLLQGFRSYGAIATPDKTLLKLEDEHTRGDAHSAFPDDEIAKIRREFDAAKQSFLNIPQALKEMPKMNPEGIYVNKNLRLDSIQVYGFDYDYTLAHYSSELQNLIYDLAMEHMVNEFHYPEVCMEFKYDPTFPIRGLSYDKSRGCLLKLDFFGSLEPDGCYYGRRKLSRTEIDEMYGTRRIGRDQAASLVGLMDFFCFSEACLIADIVQYFVDARLEFDACYIYQDVNRAIQHVHRTGLVHRGILSDPHKYLVKNGQVLHFLKMLREKGKKLFLMTNSPYYFVDGGMRFLLEDSLGCNGSWRELFDVVIAKANKPDFYTSEHPFRLHGYEAHDIVQYFVDARLEFDACYIYQDVNRAIQHVHRTGLVHRGILSDPHKYLVKNGQVLHFLKMLREKGKKLFLMTNSPYYFVDGGMRFLLEDSLGCNGSWRELFDVVIAKANKPDFYTSEHPFRHSHLHSDPSELTHQDFMAMRHMAKFHIFQELLGRLHSTVTNSQRSEAKLLLEELNECRRKASYMMKGMFNTSFGATFLTDKGQESAFAYHIHQYADVYTSKPENFLLYPPEAWLHAPFDVKIMPHHVKVSSSLFKT